MASSDKRGLFKRLTDALFDDVAHQPVVAEAQPNRAAAPNPAAHPSSTSRRELAHAIFQGRVAELLEQGHTAVVGKMQFVDLDAIKAELGERWQIIADKVREVTERTIQRRLAPTDAYVAFDGDSYLLVFADLTEPQARIKAMAIANEIRQRMTGDFNLVERYWVRAFVADLAKAGADGATELAVLSDRLGAGTELVFSRTAGPSVWEAAGRAAPIQSPRAPEQTAAAQARFEARLANISLDARRGTAGKLQLLQLDHIRAELGARWPAVAERVRDIAEQILTRRLAPIDVFAPLDEGSYLILFAALTEDEARLTVAALAREIRDRLLGELGPAVTEVGAFVAPLTGLLAAIPHPPTVAEIDRVLSQQEDIAPPPDTAQQAELRERLGEVNVSYRPTLHVKRDMISVFGAQAMRLDGNAAIHRGIAAYPPNDPPVGFEIDRAVLQHALKDVRRLVRRTERALVTVPLRLQSLIDHSSGQMVDLCRAQRPMVRRHLVIEISDLLADAPLARLSEAIAAIQPFCRALVIGVPSSFAEFERAARLGLASVGIDLEQPAPPGLTRERLLAALARFSGGAQAEGLSAFLHGIPDREILDAGRAAGFDFLNGPALAPEIARPVAMYGWAEVASG
jgi:hypothetical protein